MAKFMEFYSAEFDNQNRPKKAVINIETIVWAEAKGDESTFLFFVDGKVTTIRHSIDQFLERVRPGNKVTE